MNLRSPRFSALPVVVLALITGLASPLHAVIDAPVSPNAQPGVWRTMEFLNRMQEKYILSGQQEIAWDESRANEDVDYIRAKTGKYPAVRGFDYLMYLYSAGTRASQRSTERAIAWSGKGGIVTYCTHFFMLTGSNDGSNPHFYVPSANNNKGTNIDIRKVVVAGTPENKEFVTKLDIMAAELKRLRDANVTVIWRPFHETGGTWFWWSVNGPDGFKAAWRFMFNRFTKTHKLTNLIWCYNPADTAKLDPWYPGDDVVDMISLDVYPPAGTHPTYATDYKKMRDYKAGRKVIAMSENGSIPDPATLFTEGAGWSYFCTWNGFDNDLSRHTVDFLKKVYTHSKVVTLDEMKTIYPANSLAIISHPGPKLVPSGSKLSLSVKAAGPGTLKYQWYKGSKAITGATKSTYTVASASKSHSGNYKVTVKSAKQTLTSAIAPIVVTPTAPGRITRASARAVAGTGSRKMMVHVGTTGSSTRKKFLFRAAGPAITPSGKTGYLADPVLEVRASPTVTNDDWSSNPSTSVTTFKNLFTKVGAASFKSKSKDAAIVSLLGSGKFLTVVTGKNSTTGIAQAEVYDTAPASGMRLKYVAARAQVTATATITLSFTVSTNYRTILIRGLGESMRSTDVTAPLPDPKIRLSRVASGVSTLVTQNDQWITAPYAEATLRKIFADVEATSLVTSSKEAVILRNLAVGDYVVELSAADGNTGVGRLEIYEVP